MLAFVFALLCLGRAAALDQLEAMLADDPASHSELYDGDDAAALRDQYNAWPPASAVEADEIVVFRSGDSALIGFFKNGELCYQTRFDAAAWAVFLDRMRRNKL